MRTEPSTSFSSGTEYENFIYCFCERCKKGKLNEDGFPEFPEEGGCPIWDAMENARLGQPFPSERTLLPVHGALRQRAWLQRRSGVR